MDQIGKVKRRILLEPGKIYLVELMNGSKAWRQQIANTRNNETQREKTRIDKLVFKNKWVSQAKKQK
jgi:hypothetical protein